MDGNQRREQILHLLGNAKQPISGMQLEKQLSVSRQIIVQDIALLRVGNKNIISTTKGYILYKPNETKASRNFIVCHTNEQKLNEKGYLLK